MIKTIKSSDLYAKYSNYGDVKTNETNDCEFRAIKVNQVTNLEIDFGMVFMNVGHSEFDTEDFYAYHDFVCLYSYHCWNYNDNTIFDSQRQVDRLCQRDQENHIILSDKKCWIVDIEYLKPLLDKNTEKSQKQYFKEIKKILYRAKGLNVDFVYMSGLAWSYKTGLYMTNKDWNISLDNCEKIMSDYQNKSLSL